MWPRKEAKSYEELAEVGRLAQARLQDWLRQFKSEAHLAEEQLCVLARRDEILITRQKSQK